MSRIAKKIRTINPSLQDLPFITAGLNRFCFYITFPSAPFLHEASTIGPELAEILATRQRRERAWNVHLMICTIVIGSLNSAFANFTNEIEKEEVIACKAYLRQAIANIVAADSHPSPPQVPIHTRPNNRHLKGNDKHSTEKIAVATPRIVLDKAANRGMYKEVILSKISQVTDNAWAVVSREGQKKACEVNNINDTKTHASAGNKNAPRVVNKDNSASLSHKRLIFRLPQEHEWSKLSPAGIREVVVKRLAISPPLIGKIKPIHWEFALSPCSAEALMISTVPASIRKQQQQGDVKISSSILSGEIERVSSVRSTYVKLYGRNKPEAPHRTWMVFFEKTPRSGFRVFDESEVAVTFKKQQPLEFRKRCNGHHPAKICSRAPCLARPARSGAPNKEQRRIFRREGDRKYQAVVKARAAEEIAATANCKNVDLTDSQLSEEDIFTDNIQASPVEGSTDDARRL
ncbi:putative eka-like protein [Erysiphe necator]|uniref:Putative eka-like protein n=1 Tax=Uncinula necator TaxID=52586 RepID=A0A0B1PBD7_UNCNE|nr:putative eka-like protein [Erysiphe necator]